jgi:hypothetical protein
MGATVILFNRQERPVQKIQTDERGEFHFAGLFPEFYSVRVSLATFFPAFKRGIMVQPGMRSVLAVSLNTLFSTIQLSYPVAIDAGSIMSDEWKWVLRGSASTRPVLRLLGDPPVTTVASERTEHAFSDTRGMLRVSAGDGPIASNVTNEADMGTAFALATSLYGNNLLQVSGNLGYGSQTGVPAAAFRTSYSRAFAGGNPEVSLTMRQLFLPARLGPALAGNDAALPMLRTMSAGLDDRKQIADNVTLQYGFTLDSVTFLDRLNYFSPYSRLTWSTPSGGTLEFAYTSGNARPDLGALTGEEVADLQHDLSTLGQFPRVSLQGSKPKIQRGEEYEAAYSRKAGSRTYRVSAYYEMVRNASLSLLAPEGLFTSGDILPDLFTGNSTFNLGDHHNSGFDVSVTQELGDHITAAVIYGSDGTMTVENRELISNNPDELRAMIRAGRKHAATAQLTATAPHTGTHLIASYQWAPDQRWVMSGNLYSTQSNRPMPGLNVYIRQPLPHLGGLPWRMEATAELRNMLAQGYVPIDAGGQRLLLFDTPRSLRGGFNFIF